jgi:hypothetical protein
MFSANAHDTVELKPSLAGLVVVVVVVMEAVAP